MSAEFNNRLDTDIATVSTQAEKGLGDIRSMEERLKAFMDEMSSREKEIADKCAEVKSLADKDAKKLLDSISAEKQKFQKNVENLRVMVNLKYYFKPIYSSLFVFFNTSCSCYTTSVLLYNNYILLNIFNINATFIDALYRSVSRDPIASILAFYC